MKFCMVVHNFITKLWWKFSGFCIDEEEGCLLPTENIVADVLGWMLQSSSGWKWRSVTNFAIYSHALLRWYTSIIGGQMLAPLFLPSHHSGPVMTSSPPSWLKQSSECVIWMCRAFLLLTKMKSHFYSLKHVHAHIHTLPHPLTPTHTCTHHFNSKPRSHT